MLDTISHRGSGGHPILITRRAGADTADFADIADDAEHLIHRCEGVLRTLPRPGEPLLVRLLRAELGGNDDFVVHGAGPGEAGPWVIYLDSLVDPRRLRDEVEAPLATALRLGGGGPGGLWPGAPRATTAAGASQGILHGHVGIVVDHGGRECILYEAARSPGRAVEQPTTEQVMAGPKEAFVENLDTNLALLRGWFPDASLRLEIVRVGRRGRSRVAVAYLDDVVRPGLVASILDGLRRIRTDVIRADWQIAEYLTSGSLTTFPLAESTERPDKVAQALSGGRVAVFTEHSPFPFIVPTTIFEFQTDAEGALPGPIVTSFIRLLRHGGTFLAVTGPGLVVSLLSANPGPLRPELAQALTLTRAGLPYPVFPEMLLIMIVVDVFSEATSQAPGGVGHALSIVGTLIIGQLSVAARLVSELVMIVAAATAIGAFLTLRYQFSYSVRIWKYPILILSGVTGLFGWVAGMLFLVVHLASLKSAGVPYLSPLGPLHPRVALSQVVTRKRRPYSFRRPAIWRPADPTSGHPSGPRQRGPDDAPK